MWLVYSFVVVNGQGNDNLVWVCTLTQRVEFSVPRVAQCAIGCRCKVSYRVSLIFGQLFGTELKQSDFLIRYPLPNSVSLESFEWLLPDNGAIVVTYI